jgi:RHS repeat-associated protein
MIIVNYTSNNNPVTSYEYDYQGRRLKKTVYGSPDVVTKFCYDGDQVIAEYDGSDALLRKFIYGPGIDEPICMIDVQDNNAMYYYHFDGLGSIIAISDVNSDIVETYSYDVFGRPNTTSSIDNPYMFTGRRYDIETGLYYYRARYYDYANGRFLGPDSIGYDDGMSMYAYLGNNPVNYLDPYGLCKEDSGFWSNLWKGKYFGTGFGESSQKIWAKNYVASSGLKKFYYGTGLAFSSLWQEETWRSTTVTLGTAWLGARVSAPKSIRTPYKMEAQSMSASARTALGETKAGATLYRTGQLGKSMAAESQYWSLQNPLTPGYAGQMGMPTVAQDFIMGGSLNSGASVLTNAASGLGVNVGGGVQVVTSPMGVGIQWFVMP